MGMESKYIWMDGELVEFEKATIHILTPALHYGAAVFEGIRSYGTDNGPAVFRLWDHAERLLKSAEVFGFRELPWTTEDVVKAVKDTVRVNDFTDCYIRPLLFLDNGGWNLNVDGGEPRLSIAAWEWGWSDRRCGCWPVPRADPDPGARTPLRLRLPDSGF